MKTKELSPIGGKGVPAAPPLDPPMSSIGNMSTVDTIVNPSFTELNMKPTGDLNIWSFSGSKIINLNLNLG